MGTDALISIARGALESRLDIEIDQLLHERRQQLSRRPFMKFMEIADVQRRIKIEPHTVSTTHPSQFQQSCGGVDMTTRPDHEEQFAIDHSLHQIIHLVRLLSKPDDVRA